MRFIISALCIVPAMLIFACCHERTQTGRYVEDFEAAWNRVNDVYPFFELKEIDWDAVYARYRPLVETADEEEFHSILNNMLAELKDGHVFLRTVGGMQTRPYDLPRHLKDMHAVSPSVVKTYFDEPFRATAEGSAEYGIHPDNIGYIYLADFHETDLADEFGNIIDFMKDSKGLIIDIRQPRGGTIQNVEAVVSHFITAPFEWPRLYFAGVPYTLNPVRPRKPTYTKPVVVLINGMTISAGESTSEMLKQQPNVTLIGDTTTGGGGAASPHSEETDGNYRLPSGIVITVPTGYGLRYDGEHFEWLGVPPDIRVEQTRKDIKSGKDRQLERAIEFLK